MSEERRTLALRELGVVPYAEALELQAELVSKRRAADIPDTLLLLEHPHVVTLGSRSDPTHVLADQAERDRLGIELFKSGRGGDVTYHGPGQLVAYPILDLKPHRQDLHRYLRDLETVLIGVAASFDVHAERSEGLTGVWTSMGKLAAIGVRVSSGWITSHGVALNVSTDLDYFGAIVPCGISDGDVTSLQRELGCPVSVPEASASLVERFADVFSCDILVA